MENMTLPAGIEEEEEEYEMAKIAHFPPSSLFSFPGANGISLQQAKEIAKNEEGEGGRKGRN